MADRIRIVDIAEELGVSTATVSNVIHGKTKKISDETVKRVQALLEERQYIPSMAGILLARNDSRIVGVVVNNHEKYEGKVLEDAFVSASLNALLFELENICGGWGTGAHCFSRTMIYVWMRNGWRDFGMAFLTGRRRANGRDAPGKADYQGQCKTNF